MDGPPAMVRCDIVEEATRQAQGIMHPPPGPLESAQSKQQSREQRRSLTRACPHEIALYLRYHVTRW